MFKVGDSVFSKKFGEGVVMCVDGNDLYPYPIHVQWKNSCKRSIFTPEGRYNVRFNDPDTDICFLKTGLFKVGDHVVSRHFGKGVVTRVEDPEQYDYPVVVQWEGVVPRSFSTSEYFTKYGQFHAQYPDPEFDIIHAVEDEEGDDEEMGQIAEVINYDIAKKMHEDEEKRSAEGKKFKVGERVWSPYFGGGTVVSTESEAGDVFPIEVKWDDGHLGAFDYFTEDGKYTEGGEKPEMGIYHIDPEAATKSLPDILHELGEDEKDESNQIKRWFNESDKRDDSTVERMEDALNKKTEDAINPSHYKVEGLPEAIDIINHLMHREQYEGFLWGNILKYAYRFGRKGDKAETAGKIAWYANQLIDLEQRGYKE